MTSKQLKPTMREREALSVAEDMLDYAGYTADEIAELDLRVREMED